eukprot:7440901-Pyramimonas_sp.AAC.1
MDRDRGTPPLGREGEAEAAGYSPHVALAPRILVRPRGGRAPRGDHLMGGTHDGVLLHAPRVG